MFFIIFKKYYLIFSNFTIPSRQGMIFSFILDFEILK